MYVFLYSMTSKLYYRRYPYDWSRKVRKVEWLTQKLHNWGIICQFLVCDLSVQLAWYSGGFFVNNTDTLEINYICILLLATFLSALFPSYYLPCPLPVSVSTSPQIQLLHLSWHLAKSVEVPCYFMTNSFSLWNLQCVLGGWLGLVFCGTSKLDLTSLKELEIISTYSKCFSSPFTDLKCSGPKRCGSEVIGGWSPVCM